MSECPHGHLARSCEICERDQRITELEGRLGRIAEIADNMWGTTGETKALALIKNLCVESLDVRDFGAVADSAVERQEIKS